MDPYTDGICKNVTRHMKKRGLVLKAKEGRVRKARNGMGWEIDFPEGTAQVDYSLTSREWIVNKWKPCE